MEKLYYLDNAATTKMFEEEFDLMKKVNDEFFFNPSAAYTKSALVKKQLDSARNSILKLLKGFDGKLIFTGSATESNNTVFEGVHIRSGQTVLVSMGEHPAVFEAAKRLALKGVNVKYIPLDETGRVDWVQFEKLMTRDVAFVSIMHVSNETGAINEIKKLCAYAKGINKKVLFHSDGVQAFGKIPVNLHDLGVDFYSISAHKIYGPRGIAALWIKSGVICDPLLVGGGQEEGMRSSTENLVGAVAFAYAAQKVCAEIDQNYNIVSNLKNELVTKLQVSEIGKYFKVNSANDSSPYILSVSFSRIKGEVLMRALENEGVLVSTGSACSSKKQGNRILDAMGVSKEDVVGSLRISFSPYENYDLDVIVETFVKTVDRFEKII